MGRGGGYSPALSFCRGTGVCWDRTHLVWANWPSSRWLLLLEISHTSQPFEVFQTVAYLFRRQRQAYSRRPRGKHNLVCLEDRLLWMYITSNNLVFATYQWPRRSLPLCWRVHSGQGNGTNFTRLYKRACSNLCLEVGFELSPRLTLDVPGGILCSAFWIFT